MSSKEKVPPTGLLHERYGNATRSASIRDSAQPLATTDTYALTTWCHNGRGNFFQNVFHYQVSAASGGDDPFAMAKSLIDAWALANKTDYLAMMGSDVKLDFMSCKRITAPGGATAVKIMGDVGGSMSPSISTSFAANITWIVNSINNRLAHTFVAGIDVDSILEDVWSPQFSAKVTTFIGKILATLNLVAPAATAIYGMFTRKTNSFTPATSGELKLKPTGMNKRTMPIT